MYSCILIPANWLYTTWCFFERGVNSFNRELQAMYASIHETRRGFFEGVCASSNASTYFYDPSPPPLYGLTLIIRPQMSLSLLLSNHPSTCSKACGPMRISPLNG
jgi:hypothetical protein